MKTFLRLSVAVALLCAPLAANAQTPYGTTDLNRNTAVVDIPATGTFGRTTAQAQSVILTSPSGTPYSASGGASSSTQAVVSFRQTCTASAVQMATNTFANGVVVKGLSTNAGTAYVGPSGVTTSTGYPLVAGEAISYGVANSNQLYLICSDATSVIAVTGN